MFAWVRYIFHLLFKWYEKRGKREYYFTPYIQDQGSRREESEH